MRENVRVIRGPMVPGQTSRLWESNIFHPVYTVYLDSGLIVTNPDQFPEEIIQVVAEPNELSPDNYPLHK